MVLGRDSRLTSPALAAQVYAAAQSLGITVHDCGMISSPEFYHTLHTGPYTSGIMITASHNDADYNGFKLRLHTKPVWGDHLITLSQALPLAPSPLQIHCNFQPHTLQHMYPILLVVCPPLSECCKGFY